MPLSLCDHHYYDHHHYDDDNDDDDDDDISALIVLGLLFVGIGYTLRTFFFYPKWQSTVKPNQGQLTEEDFKSSQQVLLSLYLEVCLQGREDIDADRYVAQDGQGDDDQHPCTHHEHGIVSKFSLRAFKSRWCCSQSFLNWQFLFTVKLLRVLLYSDTVDSPFWQWRCW